MDSTWLTASTVSHKSFVHDATMRPHLTEATERMEAEDHQVGAWPAPAALANSCAVTNPIGYSDGPPENTSNPSTSNF